MERKGNAIYIYKERKLSKHGMRIRRLTPWNVRGFGIFLMTGQKESMRLKDI